MINKSNLYFTTGEFAKLFNVSKSTLFYYDEVGVFSPIIREENDYRFYAVEQIEVFERTWNVFKRYKRIYGK